MNRRTLLWAGGTAAVLGLWALFRPELLFVKTKVSETFPTAAAATTGMPEAVLTGSFQSLAHETAGQATVYRNGDGSHFLRLSGFHTSNGPDVRVFLVAAGEAPDNDSVKAAGYVELGMLKGTEGDQNYAIPAGTDLVQHRAVSIWCNRFGVNFGSAALHDADMPDGMPSG